MNINYRTPEEIRVLLQNHELKIFLDSPNNEYRFEYYTTKIKDNNTKEVRYIRTYRLHDLIRGGVTQEPWGTYDLEKQTMLVTNLIKFSHYSISRIGSGWIASCPACGNIMQGKIWESIPKTCTRKVSPKCKNKLTEKDIQERLLDDIIPLVSLSLPL